MFSLKIGVSLGKITNNIIHINTRAFVYFVLKETVYRWEESIDFQDYATIFAFRFHAQAVQYGLIGGKVLTFLRDFQEI